MYWRAIPDRCGQSAWNFDYTSSLYLEYILCIKLLLALYGIVIFRVVLIKMPLDKKEENGEITLNFYYHVLGIASVLETSGDFPILLTAMAEVMHESKEFWKLWYEHYVNKVHLKCPLTKYSSASLCVFTPHLLGLMAPILQFLFMPISRFNTKMSADMWPGSWGTKKLHLRIWILLPWWKHEYIISQERF